MKLDIAQGYGKIDTHVKNNLSKYIFLLTVFFIGIIIGGTYFNSVKENSETLEKVTDLINNIICNISSDKFKIINKYLIEDTIKIFLLTIISSSMIGLPILVVYDLYEGITLSFTLSSILYTLGTLKGNLISIILLFVPNLLMLGIILIITVSSMKLIENIFKAKKSLRLEMVRHLLVCLLAFFLMIVMSIYRIFAIFLIENMNIIG